MQACVSARCEQTTPPCAAASTTLRERERVPAAHVAEHALQALKALMSQSDGHGCELHALVSDCCGHTAPPCALAVSTARERACDPVPQDALHATHDAHWLTAQSVGHACVLHDLWCAVASHGTPPCAAGIIMKRKRACSPPPHEREHAAHADHCDSVQWIGHACAPHGCASVVAGQAMPPLSGAVVMLRHRDCVPPPQVTLHGDQAAHGDTTQSTGQASELHDRASDRYGQTTPWCCDCCTIDRDRACTPPPHVYEHCVHVLHAETVQSTGQGPRSQACVSAMCAHEAPPCAAAPATLRARARVPAEHVVLQSLQLDHDASTQSTGHACTLQVLVSLTCGQGTPPCAAGVSIARERAWYPVLHDAEQGPHSSQIDTTQSVGQLCALHVLASINDGHKAPPWARGVCTARERLCVPPPHVAVHAFHAAHCATAQCTGQPPVLHDCTCWRYGHT